MTKRAFISILLIIAAGSLAFGGGTGDKSGSDRKDPAAMDNLDRIIAKMTLEEKVAQLSGDQTGFATPDIASQKIQGLTMADGPHGVRMGKATCFPSAILLGATWDPELILRVGEAMGKEFRAKGRMVALSPCINIIRDPRGGRSFETYGEDPFLTSRMAVAIVKGIQSQQVVAVVKHYACNNQEDNRGSNRVQVNEDVLREIYLPAFKAAVIEGGAWGIMDAYNLVNGSHCSENAHLLNDILKKEWGFQGFVVSDWGATHSTANSIINGQDIEMPNGANWGARLLSAVKSGKVSMDRIDDAVKRTLRVREWAGTLGKPLYPDRNFDFENTHKAIVLEAAQKGIVLLKNANSVLPLDRARIKSIAVIGPNGNKAQPVGGGSSWVNPYYAVSPLDGIMNKAGAGIKVAYARGCFSAGNAPLDPIEDGLIDNPGQPGTKGYSAEYYNNKTLSGTPVLKRVDLSIAFNWSTGSPDATVKKDNFSVRWTGTLKAPASGEYIFALTCDDGSRLYINDTLVISDWNDHAPETKTGKYTLEQGKEYGIRVEYYENGGDAVAGLTWARPYDQDKLIAEAKDLASKSDAAVVCVGNGPDIESEGFDRKTLKLSGKQDELIAGVASVNRNTIVVVIAGPGVFMDGWIDKAASVVYLWFAGQEEGNALASVLFGDVNPAGRLPVTFPKNPEQMPAFGNAYETLDEGRGYRYYANRKEEPLFPFGFGLSYTTFEYTNLLLSRRVIADGETLTVGCDVKNSGTRAGDEVVQLYVRQKGKEGFKGVAKLKGFLRIPLGPQETKTVTFSLTPAELAYYDTAKNAFLPEPGSYELLIGASYEDIKLKEDFDVK